MLLLIDCNHLCYRAHFTTGGMTYRDTPTGVIYGFLQQIFRVISNVPVTEIAFIWDSKKSLRIQRYPYYKCRQKEQRDPKEIENMYFQFDELREIIIPKLGFKNNFIQEGYEADDIIGKICYHLNAKYTQNERILIVSGDDDLLQLLDTGQVYMYKRKGIRFYSSTHFSHEYKIPAQDWAAVKSIAGCVSDTVPGVKGIGEKTAIRYLTGQLSPKTKAYQCIKNSKQVIEKTRWLVQLPLPGTEMPNIRKSTFQTKEFQKICTDYGFKKWIYNPSIFNEWEMLLK